MVSFLAVGLAAGVADLSDERRPSVGIGTTYLFMLVAGLYNVALLQSGPEGVRALLLYGISASVAWITGSRRASNLFDAEAAGRATLSPTVGALSVVMLFLGDRAVRLLAGAVGVEELLWAQLPWVALVGGGVVLHRLRRSGPAKAAHPGLALGYASALGLLGGIGAQLFEVAPVRTVAAAMLLATRALVEEVAIRGVIQAGLAPATDSRTARSSSALAVGLSVLAAWSVSAAPFAPTGVAAAIAPALTFWLTGRLWASLLTRGLIEGLSFF